LWRAAVAAQQDASPHKVRVVTVETGVQLEILDWGGQGPPLVFMGGTDAHVFDDFAPTFTSGHHVYGISQQGFGKSSAPDPTATNYTAANDRTRPIEPPRMQPAPKPEKLTMLPSGRK
jgi:hypothetical protein